MIIDVDEILCMHQSAVERWHRQDIDNPHAGFMHIACHQCSLNYRLWHQEDIARSPDAADAELAQVKRNIDKLNQQRNDHIELMDDWISVALQRTGASAADNAPLNTETPGSVVDRLAILALRIFHLDEQLQRRDVNVAHRQSVKAKRAVCLEQRADLARSLQLLLGDISSGRKRHKTYRQFKMYNDPTLNPYLYQSKEAA